jgi:hypothetical protein
MFSSDRRDKVPIGRRRRMKPILKIYNSKSTGKNLITKFLESSIDAISPDTKEEQPKTLLPIVKFDLPESLVNEKRTVPPTVDDTDPMASLRRKLSSAEREIQYYVAELEVLNLKLHRKIVKLQADNTSLKSAMRVKIQK